MGWAHDDKVEKQAQLRVRLHQLQRRAVKFKQADRQILVTERLFELFDLAEEIWFECEQLKQGLNGYSGLARGLDATKREVLLHFILSALGYLPAHCRGGGAVTDKSRLLQVASKTVKMGMAHPDLHHELEVFAHYMDEAFDAAIELPELREIVVRREKRKKRR